MVLDSDLSYERGSSGLAWLFDGGGRWLLWLKRKKKPARPCMKFLMIVRDRFWYKPLHEIKILAYRWLIRQRKSARQKEWQLSWLELALHGRVHGTSRRNGLRLASPALGGDG